MGMKVPTQKDSDDVTARLDAVYSEEPSEIDEELLEAHRRALNDAGDPLWAPVIPRLASRS